MLQKVQIDFLSSKPFSHPNSFMRSCLHTPMSGPSALIFTDKQFFFLILKIVFVYFQLSWIQIGGTTPPSMWGQISVLQLDQSTTRKPHSTTCINLTETNKTLNTDLSPFTLIDQQRLVYGIARDKDNSDAFLILKKEEKRV